MSDLQISNEIRLVVIALEEIEEGIKAQTKTLQTLVDFLTNAPEFAVEELGSAEEDHIDDSMEETNDEELAIKEIQEEWVESGYNATIEELFPRH